MNDAATICDKVTLGCGRRGRGDVAMSTDAIMALTRGE